MKFLIVYGTTEGQTRKIAQFMADQLQMKGYEVSLADAADNPPSPEGFDATLIGASIHIHRYQTSVQHYIKKYAAELNNMPSAFFSVCLAVVSNLEEEHAEAAKIASHLLDVTEWKPTLTTQIAGALKYTEYDFFKRLIMKMIAKREGHPTNASKDYEYTDWNKVKDFVLEFAEKTKNTSAIQSFNISSRVQATSGR